MLNICLAFIMFGVALGIKKSSFIQLHRHPKWLLGGVISQFVLLPLFTYLLIITLQPPASLALGMILVAACPGGNISNFFTHFAKGNTELSVSLTVVSTFMAVLSTPFHLHFWGNLYPPTQHILRAIEMDFWYLTKMIGLLMGIPLFLGAICQYYLPNISDRLGVILKYVSVVIFILLIGVGFKSNWQIFTNYIHLVIGWVIVHNILALVLGFVWSTILRFPLDVKKSITIETGIQNSGLGLLLIFSFFEEIGGMAILAAVWGIWHIISGLGIASFWSFTSTIKNK